MCESRELGHPPTISSPLLGTRLESRSDPLLIGCLTAVAVSFATAYLVTRGNIWLVAAAPPALMALAVWLTTPRRFSATILETGLQLHPTGEMIPWSSIDRFYVAHSDRLSYPIRLEAADRTIDIPEPRSVRAADLVQFLVGVVQFRELPPRDLALAEFYRTQRDRFGAEQVWYAAGFGRLPRARSIGTGTAVLLGLVLPATVVSLYYGGSGENRDETFQSFALCGMFLFSIGLFVVSAINSDSQRHIIRSGRDFGVVVTPAGVAVRQRKLRGKFRWDHVREVRFLRGGSLFALTAEGYAAGIELRVAGLRVKILDLYDRPLTAIHEQIMQNWQKQFAAAVLLDPPQATGALGSEPDSTHAEKSQSGPPVVFERCPFCGRGVIRKSDGSCPSCQESLL